MNINKKLVLCTSLAAMVALLVTACGQSAGGDGDHETSTRERATRTPRSTSSSSTSHTTTATSHETAPAASGHGEEAGSSEGHGSATLVSANTSIADGHGASDTHSHGAAAAHEESGSTEHAGPVHWSYEGEYSPAKWGEIDGFEVCGVGLTQSPININYSFPTDVEDIDFNYGPSAFSVVNNGHTIQANLAEGNSITVDGEQYNLLQFHFHSPSENIVNNKPYAMEGHLVHANDHGELAVLAVLYGVGDNNDALDPVWNVLPKETGKTVEAHGQFDPNTLLPKDTRTFRFSGSLTTPPCSEGVRWNVLTTPVQASRAQVDLFHGIFGDNNRPVQPLNGREVTEDIIG